MYVRCVYTQQRPHTGVSPTSPAGGRGRREQAGDLHDEPPAIQLEDVRADGAAKGWAGPVILFLWPCPGALISSRSGCR